MMTYRIVSRTIIGFCVYLTLIVTINEALQCDKWKCPGPLIFYESLNCTPVYGNDDCCADYYNCDHLFKRIANTDKVPTNCYFDGREFQIGERLTGNHTFRKNCICKFMDDGMPDFDCDSIEMCSTCKYTSDSCLDERMIEEEYGFTGDHCLEKIKEWGLTCSKSGITYYEGEIILPDNKSEKICKCEAVERDRECGPFSTWFDPHSAAQFYKGCVPIYTLDRKRAIKINQGYQRWKCQKPNEIIIDKNNTNTGSEMSKEIHGPVNQFACIERHHKLTTRKDCIHVNPQGPPGEIDDRVFRQTCIFGQRKMFLGDKLNSTIFGKTYCIVCICEVPPIPTCVMKPKPEDTACEVYNVPNKISACDKQACPGPTPFYKLLKCLPVYKTPSDCCPYTYNCDKPFTIMGNDIKNTCYVNGHVYKFREKIKKADEPYCQKNCVCIKRSDGVPDIFCQNDDILDCVLYNDHLSLPMPSPDDLLLDGSCQSEFYPNATNATTSKCEKFGVSYSDGDYIDFAHRPDAICKCQVYDNGTSAILCTPISRVSDVHSLYMFHIGCAPVYIPDKVFSRWNGQTIRLHEKNRVLWRCPKVGDTRYKYKEDLNYMKGDFLIKKCNFGHWAMDISDRLNNVILKNDKCIVCTCQVPPVLTCIIHDDINCTEINEKAISGMFNDWSILDDTCSYNVLDRRRNCEISMYEYYYSKKMGLDI